MLPAGTEIALLAKQRIDSKDVVQGQTFLAQINDDVRESDGSIAIPRGSGVRLVTRRVESNGDITLDVDSITVAGRRYRVSTANEELQNRRDGIGGNERTGKYVGGGAILGAVIGAYATAKATKGRPAAIVAYTKKGYPIMDIIHDPNHHGKALTPDEAKAALAYIDSYNPQLRRDKDKD